MAEREIEKWVTVSGHHVPIYKNDNNVLEAEKRKERQIKESAEQANKARRAEDNKSKNVVKVTTKRGKDITITKDRKDYYDNLTFRQMRNMHFDNLVKELPDNEFSYLVDLYNRGVDKSIGIEGLDDMPIIKAFKENEKRQKHYKESQKNSTKTRYGIGPEYGDMTPMFPDWNYR